MVEIQSLLTDRDLGNKFNSDRRKFSRNYDGSFFSEEYNFGANYHGNLIFSPRSYIPRSASFNVSFDLFGRSVNAFELNTRFEGLEYYAEKFFGPDGPYSNEKMSRFFTNFLRRFRSAPEEDYWKRVKRIPNVIDNNFDNPRISYGYKVNYERIINLSACFGSSSTLRNTVDFRLTGPRSPLESLIR